MLQMLQGIVNRENENPDESVLQDVGLEYLIKKFICHMI